MPGPVAGLADFFSPTGNPGTEDGSPERDNPVTRPDSAAGSHLSGMSPFELGQTVPSIETLIRLAGALETTPGAFTAGVIWKPPQTLMTPGGFQVADDPTHAAEAAALREEAARKRLALEERARGRRTKK